MMIMREVLVYSGLPQEVRGLFHCWGSEVIETNDGNMAESFAIVELEDGTVANVYPRLVKFLTPPETEKKFCRAERIAELENEIEALKCSAE
jgi:hypothetical protein